VLPPINDVVTNNTTDQNINFNAPAIALNEVNLNNNNLPVINQPPLNRQVNPVTNTVSNTLPETKPYVEQTTQPEIIQDLPKTSALITTDNALQELKAAIEIEQVGFVQRGHANFYPGNRNDKVTVTGEEYNMNQLIATHANIQLNSIVRVTNLDNGKVAMVRINDRPTAKDLDEGYIISLSLKAAETLGMTEKGIIDVKLELVSAGNEAGEVLLSDIAKDSFTPKVLSPKELKAKELLLIAEKINPVNTYDLKGIVKNPEGYGVQIAAYNNQLNALEKGIEYEALQFNNILIQAGWNNGVRSYRVLIGEFENKEDAEALISFLKSKEITPFIRKHMSANKQ
ncbi:MAG: septal ring lytic transglycosylase RlpA family protein, partial [Bacteroidota bacterium]